LSAYKDKALHEAWYVRNHCCKVAKVHLSYGTQNIYNKQECEFLLHHGGPMELHLSQDDFSFETFVKGFMKQCSDPHWAPQAHRMKPMNWKFINFIGRLDTVAHDARCLLEKIGAWEAFGANGWGRYRNMSFFETNFAKHATSASTSLDKYYTPELKEIVMQYLQSDFELLPFLNFTKPTITGSTNR
jgi:hypothetical protein